jgi:hypothetical protein
LIALWCCRRAEDQEIPKTGSTECKAEAPMTVMAIMRIDRPILDDNLTLCESQGNLVVVVLDRKRRNYDSDELRGTSSRFKLRSVLTMYASTESMQPIHMTIVSRAWLRHSATIPYRPYRCPRTLVQADRSPAPRDDEEDQ